MTVLDQVIDELVGAGRDPEAGPELAGTPLAHLGATFGLDPGELALVVAAAGVELDDRVTHAIGGDALTIDTAARLVDGVDVHAVDAAGRLRRARLIVIDESVPLHRATIRVDLDVLGFLLGHPRLAAALEPVVRVADGKRARAMIGHDEQLAARWLTSERPVVVVDGADAEAVVAAAAHEVGLRLGAVDLRALGHDPAVIDELAALWNRDAALHRLALFLDLDDVGDPAPSWPAERLAETVTSPLAVGGWIRPRLRGRPWFRFETPRSTPGERSRWWRRALADHPGSATRVAGMAAHFPLGPTAVAQLAASVDHDADDAADQLWDAARAVCRAGLDGFALRMDRRPDPDRLVVPDRVHRQLDAIVDRIEGASQVFDEWGWDDGGRGRGVVAVFAGRSGTGKTLAAEVVAARLDLDLYRIDLSSTVSKWLGETEKNLARIFDAAEASGAVLLFDEADAIFGRRTEVRDSHDRYANLEVSYLLQRLERFGGLAILTTNMEGNVDDAFRRRFSFVVEFPAPGPDERRQLWDRLLDGTEVGEDVDASILAQLAVTGGDIANIARGAAFRAASVGAPIDLTHVRDSAIDEYAKADRVLTASELRGFP